MKKSFYLWNECINIKNIVQLDFYENIRTNHFENNDVDNCLIIDSILSNLPIPTFIIIKDATKLYTNQYNLIQYIKSFIDNKITIEKCNYYLNNITGNMYKDLTVDEKEQIISYLVNCTIVDASNQDDRILEQLFFRYNI